MLNLDVDHVPLLVFEMRVLSEARRSRLRRVVCALTLCRLGCDSRTRARVPRSRAGRPLAVRHFNMPT
jgi:hypothetical protein